MAWVKGQPWRVVGSLDVLRDQIRTYAPRAVPPATPAGAWGAIADDAHSSSSDHYPHFYAALGATAVVCARDFPHAPQLGLDGRIVTEALRISRDPRIGYIICDRRITGPNHGWLWATYTGPDPHDTHFHISSVHSGLADDTRPWTLPGQVTAQTLGDDAMVFRLPSGACYIPTVAGPVQLQGSELPAGATIFPVASAERLKQLCPAATADVNLDQTQLAAVVEALQSGLSGTVSTAVQAELNKTRLVVNE